MKKVRKVLLQMVIVGGIVAMYTLPVLAAGGGGT